MFIIQHKTKKMFIHFNAHTQQYYIDDKMLGAVLFKEHIGKQFIYEFLHPDEFEIKDNDTN